MAKEKLKKQKDNFCKICGEVLPDDFAEFDTHREKMRMDGGTYTPDNYDTVCPICHMKEHGNYKERAESIEEIKAIYDRYKQIQKTRMKIDNQLLAGERRKTDYLTEEDKDYLHDISKQIKGKEKDIEKEIKKWVKESKKNMPIVKAMDSVNGVGPVFIAACLTYIDIEKAEHPSSLWSYFGYHAASHKRYDKLTEPVHYTDSEGKEKKRWYNPGNDVLRSQAFVTAGVFVKGKNNLYKDVYYTRKEKTSKSSKITKTRITGKSGIHEMAWKDVSKGHRHGDAQRVMMKYFIADLWLVWRTLEGLPTNDLYVKEHLGHKSAIIDPEKRGWVF